MAKPYTSRLTAQQTDPLDRESGREFPLVKLNFILMAVAILVIVVGFLLMLGSPSTATEFNPDIFSTRRIVVGPTVAFLGFIFMGVAIMWPVKRSSTQNISES